jgi:hypothetical protein
MLFSERLVDCCIGGIPIFFSLNPGICAFVNFGYNEYDRFSPISGFTAFPSKSAYIPHFKWKNGKLRLFQFESWKTLQSYSIEGHFLKVS